MHSTLAASEAGFQETLDFLKARPSEPDPAQTKQQAEAQKRQARMDDEAEEQRRQDRISDGLFQLYPGEMPGCEHWKNPVRVDGSESFFPCNQMACRGCANERLNRLRGLMLKTTEAGLRLYSVLGVNQVTFQRYCKAHPGLVAEWTRIPHPVGGAVLCTLVVAMSVHPRTVRSPLFKQMRPFHVTGLTDLMRAHHEWKAGKAEDRTGNITASLGWHSRFVPQKPEEELAPILAWLPVSAREWIEAVGGAEAAVFDHLDELLWRTGVALVDGRGVRRSDGVGWDGRWFIPDESTVLEHHARRAKRPPA